MENTVEKTYTEKELKDRLNEQKEIMDYEISKMKEKFSKEMQTVRETYNGAINTLQDENAFYKNIIKSILHI